MGTKGTQIDEQIEISIPVYGDKTDTDTLGSTGTLTEPLTHIGRIGILLVWASSTVYSMRNTHNFFLSVLSNISYKTMSMLIPSNNDLWYDPSIIHAVENADSVSSAPVKTHWGFNYWEGFDMWLISLHNTLHFITTCILLTRALWSWKGNGGLWWLVVILWYFLFIFFI